MKLIVSRVICSLWFLVGIVSGVVWPGVSGAADFARKQLRGRFGRVQAPKLHFRVLCTRLLGTPRSDFVESKTRAEEAGSDVDGVTLCGDQTSMSDASEKHGKKDPVDMV
jgi:hypothetical protein